MEAVMTLVILAASAAASLWFITRGGGSGPWIPLA